MMNQGLGDWPRRRAEMSPDRTALIWDETETTYAELAERVYRLSSVLRDRGIHRGSRVAYFGTNHPAFFEVLFAVTALGATFVPVNHRLAVDEVTYILNDAEVSIVFYGADKSEHITDFIEATPSVKTWIPAETEIDELIRDADELREHVPVSLDDIAIIMYTSGTTGRPKGAMISHGNFTWATINQMIDLDIRKDDTSLAVAPLFHIGGLNGTVMSTFLKGGRTVILRGFEPESVLRAIDRYSVNSMFTVPTMLDMLSTHELYPQVNVSSLRSLVVGGAAPSDTTLERWLSRGVHIQQAFGMTEAAPTVTMLSSEDARSHRGSAGKRSFFTELKVVRSDGTDADVGEVGEVWLRGPNVIRGYWQRPDADDAFEADWYKSGDAALMDRDGYLYIRDRYKDMYISGGENVYPAEVENVLMSCPGVAEVAVIGVQDEKWGEVGVAVIVLQESQVLDEATVIAHARAHLAGYKVPKSVRIVASLPKTASGKITKQVLRDELR